MEYIAELLADKKRPRRDCHPLVQILSILYLGFMNQDQVMGILKKLEPKAAPFKVIFSGKESRRAYGCYHPDGARIIIHNGNFKTENGLREGALLYTAVHEFAHHMHFTTAAIPVGVRAHTREFRRIFHSLLEKAEEMSLMENPYASYPDLKNLTEEIQQKVLTTQGEQAREFGSLLIRAEALCTKHGLRFEDYVERILQFDRSTVRTIMRIPALELPPRLGYENMKLIAAERQQDRRNELTRRLLGGESRDLAKGAVKPPPSKNFEEEDMESLRREKQRLEHTIQTLQTKLHEVENRMRELKES